MKIAEVVAALESYAPLALQENYDNAGLVVGNPEMEATSALLCIDVTEAILEEALQLGANLIISHHPVIFNPLKRITGSGLTERMIIAAIKNNLALYSVHTNLDNHREGVNLRICQKLGLHEPEILHPAEKELNKLVTFVPLAYADQVKSALFAAGAGHIGKYDQCSFSVEGQGSFRASEGAKPFTGEIGKLHLEKEIRIETVFPAYLRKKVLDALMVAHPYEEVAYDLFPLVNISSGTGAGMLGKLDEPVNEKDFFTRVKSIFGCGVIRVSPFLNNLVEKVAVCGGSGSFLIGRAIEAGAHVFLTADIKYHQFFEAEGKLVIADIGHYESEQFTIEIFYEVLMKKLPNFAVHFSGISTNCITYL
jgi:dinuclear metal center YbgI/SA1388 family protein